MKKEILILLIIFMSCSQNGKNSKNPSTEISQNWTEYKTKDSIPELLKLTLQKINKDNFKIADFNREFEMTDVIMNDTLPTRQLRLLAKKNNDWRLSYIQGGYGKHYVYAECKIENDLIFNFKIVESNLKLENNDLIDKLLNEKKITLKEIKIRTE